MNELSLAFRIKDNFPALACALLILFHQKPLSGQVVRHAHELLIVQQLLILLQSLRCLFSLCSKLKSQLLGESRDLKPRFGGEFQSCTIYLKSQTQRLWPIIEDMSQMRLTLQSRL